MNGIVKELYGYNASTGNLTTSGGATLAYGEPSHDHAVTAMGSNTYSYDANGNQKVRTIAGVTYSLGYDAENRMVSVSSSGLNSSFLYDGDGRRVKSTINGVVTTFVGNHYEVSTGKLSKYYFLGGARVAMRQAGLIYYPLTDHLGSTTLTTDGSGAVVSELRYTAWGKTRFTSGSTPTKYQFTGQYSNEPDFGLMYFNARWYDPYLKHFVLPDSLIPDPYNSLDYNRYAYTRYNPLKYNDSTGHVPEWFYTVLGATAQYMDDVSLGLFSQVAGSLDVVNNKAYQDGRSYGRGAAIVQSSVETVVGAYVAAALASAIGPTTGGGLACAVATGGACAAPAGVALTAEGAGVVGGSAMAGHGAMMMAKIKGSQPGNSSNPQFNRLSDGEIKMLENAGYDVHDLKGGKNASSYDLYKDQQGNIVVKRLGGLGPGEDLGINLHNLRNER